MKAYTDLEQSKKLAEILPLESADMHYNDWSYDFLEGYEHTGRYKVDLGTPKTICGELDIPCWSLAALLGVLPNSIYDNTDEYSQIEFSKRSVAYHDMDDGIKVGSIQDNLIDACYKLILKLHEQKLL